MRAFALLPLVALVACTVGPDYADPKLPVPPAFDAARGLPNPAKVAALPTVPGVDPAEWWRQFRDPELDRLIALALRGNLDVQIAAARIAGARAQERIAGSARFPTIDSSAGINRVDFSKNAGLSSIAGQLGGGGGGGSTAGQGVAGPGSGITTWSLAVDASWEIDLFGGVRRGVEGARARAAAAEWNARDVRVSISAEVASNYLMLRSLQRQIGIANDERTRQDTTFKLIGARRRAGLITELPESQQALQLSNVAATLPQLEAQARAQINALGVLAGEQPGMFAVELTPVAALPAAPPTVPVGLPSDLLRRRPDIRAAERQLAAANADIGVAVADLYPRFNLTGMAELITTSLKTLFELDSLQTTGMAGVTLPLLDGGARRGTIQAREASRDEALLNYKRTVLVAVQDVEDALARYTAEQRRNAEVRRGLVEAERGERLARASYEAGLVDFLNVLDAQAALLSNRNTLAQSDATLLTNLALVYRALGGGWEPQEAAPLPTRSAG